MEKVLRRETKEDDLRDPLVGSTGAIDWESATSAGVSEFPAVEIPPGGDLFSHSVARAVS